MRTRLLINLVLPLILAGSAGGSEPVRIGVTLGLTGRYSEMAGMQEMGYRLWERQANEKGGLLGRDVKVIIWDDNSDREKALSLYEEMIADDKVDLVFGPYSSGITNAILQVTAKHGYPVLAGGASSDRLWQQGYGNIFGIYTPASRYAVGFLEMLVVKRISQVAIVGADDPFSKSISAGTRKWANRYGLDVTYFSEFKKGTEDVEAIVTEARDSGARVLIVCGHFDEAVRFMQASRKIGWLPEAYYASVGPVLKKYRDTLGDEAEGSFSSSQWEPHPDLAYPGSREFLASFRETYGVEPSYHAATAFSSGVILEKAVSRAGTINRKKLIEMLGTLDTMSPIGRYGVDRTGMQIRQFPVIIQWQGNKKEIVWPVKLRTAEPVFR